MLSRIFFFCLCVALFSTGSSLNCKWLGHKFRQCSETSLNLLEAMANNSTNTTKNVGVTFPKDLYRQASKASAEDKVSFTVQVLEEVAGLFEEDHSSVSWENITIDHFLSVVGRQVEGLHSCIGSHKKNKKLQMYFKRLSHHALDRMGHSTEAWELITKEIRTHLMRTDQLVSSLLN